MKLTEEKYYPPPLKIDSILTLIDILDDETLDKITPTLIGEWPNTCVYTKAIAEDVVRQYSVELPVCILRSSAVITTAKESIPGWTNNLYGPIGAVVNRNIGLMHSIQCNPAITAEIMPADYVIANIIVADWDTAKRKYVRDTLLSVDNARPDVSETERTPIYNCVSSTQNPITWGKFFKYTKDYGSLIPTINMMWYCIFTLNKYRFVHIRDIPANNTRCHNRCFDLPHRPKTDVIENLQEDTRFL